MDNTKTAFTSFVTDLVNHRAISSEYIEFENGKWTVKKSILGLQEGSAYEGKQSLIDAIMEHGMPKYVGVKGLRSAS